MKKKTLFLVIVLFLLLFAITPQLFKDYYKKSNGTKAVGPVENIWTLKNR